MILRVVGSIARCPLCNDHAVSSGEPMCGPCWAIMPVDIRNALTMAAPGSLSWNLAYVMAARLINPL